MFLASYLFIENKFILDCVFSLTKIVNFQTGKSDSYSVATKPNKKQKKGKKEKKAELADLKKELELVS